MGCLSEDLISLNSIDSLGFTRLKNLLDAFGDTGAILNAKKEALVSVAAIDAGIAEKIASVDREFAKIELEAVHKNGISLVSIFDEGYPDNLKNISSPPILLYVKGKIEPQDEDAVAVVGTRQPTHYGISLCEKLSGDMAGWGLTVISGLARGIDTVAHKAACGNGRTIAVLGSGLNRIYPGENKGLSDRICDVGAVISEFSLDTPPNRYNFPRRNRVISGLSLGVLVIEASGRSGSLITSNFALDQNREVFALPGQADSSRSKGTNNLIKQGAKLVESIDDIIPEIASNLRHGPYPPRSEYGRKSQDFQRIELTTEEMAIKECLGSEPVYIDELARKTKMSLSSINFLLLNLELKKVVQELPGRNFILR